MSKLFQYGLPLGFSAVLLLFWVDAVFLGAGAQVPSFENKKAVKKPDFRLNYLDPFPRDAEAYFNDRFPWKGVYQRFNGHLQALTKARSPLPDLVVLGNDDWLYKGGLQLDIYRGKRRFSPAELTQVIAELGARRDSIRVRGGHYYLIVAPLKHHIYPQFLPEHVRPLNETHAVAQLQTAMREANLPFIDLHVPLKTYAEAHPPESLAASDSLSITHNLYYRTDHHWTVRAGLLAANLIIDSLRQDGLYLTPLDPNTYRMRTRTNHGMTLAKMIGLDRDDQDHFLTLHHPWITEEIDRPDLQPSYRFPYPSSYVKHRRQKELNQRLALPSLFVTRESFGENIILPLSEHFGKSFFLFDEWNHQLNLDHYDREGQAEVYLQLVWEGFLFNLLELPEDDGKW
ncbi:MAG: hypothetical protein AAGF89_07180 [Bacteroidota bacterium]